MLKTFVCKPLLFMGMLLAAISSSAQGELAVAVESGVASAAPVSLEMFTVNNVWMLLATFLVFIMHLGFASLECGLTRAKNTVNILFKNTLIPAIGLLTYAFIGFNLMYPGGAWKIAGFVGFAGFGLGTDAAGLTSAYNVGYTYWTDFLFQGMFAATAATIVSGAVAERVKLSSFLVFSVVYVGLIYPVVGSWCWGGGWLAGLNFHDLAGSTFVHSVGGWAALAGVIVIGPRIGKYVNGVIRPIMGHSMPLAAVGAFLLWFGWFGFNAGSVLSADPGAISYVCVTTTMSAAAGIVAAMMASWLIQKKPDLSMVLNGCLAGLVGITAPADCVTVSSAVIIGLVAGVLVVLAVNFFDHLRLDDPVGAISVHLVCGIWGTLAVGLFADEAVCAAATGFSLKAQLYGVLGVGAVCFTSAMVIFAVLKAVVGIRVDAEEELRGLDIGEHGMEAYSGFQIFSSM